jgi:hypothetical protein
MGPRDKAWPARDADNSAPPSVKVNNEDELYLPSPLAPAWHVQDSFTLLLDSMTCILHKHQQ